MVEPRRTTPSCRSKYSHHTAATATNPETAAPADAGRQCVPAVPMATATTDSPSTISVNRAHRSGRWLALVRTLRWIRVVSGGRLSSSTCATTHTAYREGVGTNSEASHRAAPTA